MKTSNLAIMFTDIKGYTERTGQSSHRETSSLLRRHQALVVPVIEGFDGRVVKTIGDAFLAVFRSPTSAVQCATTIQDRLYRHNHGLPTADQIHLRIAVNVGEVLLSRGDVFGEPVNVASRVEGITPANEVYLTEAVYLAMNRSEVRTEKVGGFELKGVREPVQVYRVPPFSTGRVDTGEMPIPPLSSPGLEPVGGRAATSVLVLPFGGQLLARLEAQRMTPVLRRRLVAGAVALVAAIFALVAVPGALRARQWERIEALIGRGETDAALSALGRLEHGGESDRARYFDLQAHLANRLIDKGEGQRTVGLMTMLDPQTPEERNRYARLQRQVFDALLQQATPQAAIRLLDDARQKLGAEEPIFDERVRLARYLLDKGRLDELAAQVHVLVAADNKNPVGKVLTGHLHFALSARQERAANLLKALKAYEEALQVELAAGDDDRLRVNVAAAYSNGVPEARKAAEILAAADVLVDKYLRRRALEALVHQLDQPNNSKEARDRLAVRIQQLGGEKEVDRVKLMIQDLHAAGCKGGATGPALKLIEQLRDEGAGDPRAVGALVRVAQRHDDCEKPALDAVHRIVGERLGFMSADDVHIRDTVAKLKGHRCRKGSDDVLADLVRLGDARSAGPILQLASTQEECAEPGLKAVEALVGRKVSFENAAETRFLEVLGALRGGSCTTKAGTAALQDTIRAAGRTGDRRLVGELLALAGKGSACSEPALSTARALLKADELALTCVNPLWRDLETHRCRDKKDTAAAKKTVEAVVAEGDPRGVGALLQLAARKNGCSEAALAGARTLLKADGLSLSCGGTGEGATP